MPAESDLKSDAPEREQRIRVIVDALLATPGALDSLNIRAACAQHPDLAPQFEQALRAAVRIRRARGEATSNSDAATQATRPIGVAGAHAETVATAVSSASQAQLSHALPGFEIIREIHRGGQGVVYQAVQKSTHRRVAIKVMKEGPFASSADRARFEREVRILGQLDHPNIVAIHDTGVAAGCHYLVMDYISGEPLDVFMVRVVGSIEETLRLFAKICVAVSAAHQRGIVHRDLKPGNIRVDSAGEPHILDFGLAKVAAAESGEEPAIAGSTIMTVTGQFLGSLPWASPEQAEGTPSKIDVRTDVYALGVILFQMLTGEFPYDVTGNLHAVLARIRLSTPLRPASLRRDLDGDVETIVLRCLQKERARRYQTVAELALDVENWLRGDPIAAKRDSIAYVVRTRARRWSRRHPLGAGLLTAAAASIIAQFAGVPLVYKTPLNRSYERLMMAAMPPPGGGAGMEHTRVIAITDQTDIDSLARRENITGVSADNLRSLRRLHGRMMQRLAQARPRVVAWDIAFRQPSEFDDDFVAGVRALRAAGVDVVIRVPSWAVDDSGRPRDLSSSLITDVKWGATMAAFSASQPWELEFALQRGRADPQPSLALAAISCARHPLSEVTYRIDEAGAFMELAYWRADPLAPRARQWLDSEILRVTGVQTETEDAPEGDLRRGDVLATYCIALPTPEALAAATVDYAALFSADEDQLRRWFGDRIVVVGDMRTVAADRFPTTDGRSLPGCYGHAAATEALWARRPIRAPASIHIYPLTVGAAVIGVAIGFWQRRRPWQRLAALACLVGVAGSGCAAAFAWNGYLLNPAIPLFAAILAAEIAARLDVSRLAAPPMLEPVA